MEEGEFISFSISLSEVEGSILGVGFWFRVNSEKPELGPESPLSRLLLRTASELRAWHSNSRLILERWSSWPSRSGELNPWTDP